MRGGPAPRGVAPATIAPVVRRPSHGMPSARLQAGREPGRRGGEFSGHLGRGDRPQGRDVLKELHCGCAQRTRHATDFLAVGNRDLVPPAEDRGQRRTELACPVAGQLPAGGRLLNLIKGGHGAAVAQGVQVSREPERVGHGLGGVRRAGVGKGPGIRCEKL